MTKIAMRVTFLLSLAVMLMIVQSQSAKANFCIPDYNECDVSMSCCSGSCNTGICGASGGGYGWFCWTDGDCQSSKCCNNACVGTYDVCGFPCKATGDSCGPAACCDGLSCVGDPPYPSATGYCQ